MKLKKTFVSTVAALALAGGTTGAFADDGTEVENEPVLSCLINVALPIGLIGEAEATQPNCSAQAEEETEVSVEVEEDDDDNGHHNNR